MDMEERLNGFIRDRIKEKVSDSMFESIQVLDLDAEIPSNNAKRINDSIGDLTDVIVEVLMENKK